MRVRESGERKGKYVIIKVREKFKIDLDRYEKREKKIYKVRGREGRKTSDEEKRQEERRGEKGRAERRRG